MSTRVPPTAQIGAMLEALYEGDVQLKTLVPNGMYPDVVPQKGKVPALVYAFGDMQPLRAMGMRTIGWTVEFVVVAIDEGQAKVRESMLSAGERLIALLDEQKPTVEGWRVVKLMLTRALSASEDRDGRIYRRSGGMFRVWLEPA
jgi:hypothetical protein